MLARGLEFLEKSQSEGKRIIQKQALQSFWHYTLARGLGFLEKSKSDGKRGRQQDLPSVCHYTLAQGWDFSNFLRNPNLRVKR